MTTFWKATDNESTYLNFSLFTATVITTAKANLLKIVFTGKKEVGKFSWIEKNSFSDPSRCIWSLFACCECLFLPCLIKIKKNTGEFYDYFWTQLQIFS